MIHEIIKAESQLQQAGVILLLTQAETVSLELDLIRAGLENVSWSQKNWSPKVLSQKMLVPKKFGTPKVFISNKILFPKNFVPKKFGLIKCWSQKIN